MSPEVVTIPAKTPIKEVLHDYFLGGGGKGHQAYPVVDDDGNAAGRGHAAQPAGGLGVGEP